MSIKQSFSECCTVCKIYNSKCSLDCFNYFEYYSDNFIYRIPKLYLISIIKLIDDNNKLSSDKLSWKIISACIELKNKFNNNSKNISISQNKRFLELFEENLKYYE